MSAAAAAVAAAAPRVFAPVSVEVLNGITAASAAVFRFWVALGLCHPEQQGQGQQQQQTQAAKLKEQTNGNAGNGARRIATGGNGGREDGNSGSASGARWGWWGAEDARAALQQLEVLPQSARERATEPWVGNHYRWIVWKLAAYERRCARVRKGAGWQANRGGYVRISGLKLRCRCRGLGDELVMQTTKKWEWRKAVSVHCRRGPKAAYRKGMGARTSSTSEGLRACRSND